MPGYWDTKKLIIDTLVGRPVGTLIFPEGHQNFALSLLDYIRSVEVLGASSLQGVAEQDTVPVQPDNARICYIATVPPNRFYTFENFRGEDGQPIQVVSGLNTITFCTLLWNGEYWSVQTTQMYSGDQGGPQVGIRDLLTSGTKIGILTINGVDYILNVPVARDGKSAYQIWLDEGNVGTEADFIASLKGDTGVSADYPITIYNGLDSSATDQALSALQGKLMNQKIQNLVNAGYSYVGVAFPVTNPGVPSLKVYYLAGPGTYPNFGNATVPDGKLGILKYNSGWSLDTISVGKDYDGYFGIVYGSDLTESETTSQYIDENGNLIDNSVYGTDYIVKRYDVTGGKSYYISGLEAGNSGTCGWATYNGATKVSYGATNISANTTVTRIPDDATILYVCQPNYGNLPVLSVKETTSIIDTLDARLDGIEKVVGTGGIINTSNIDIANYALVADIYTNKIWDNSGLLVEDPLSERNATSMVMIDKTKDIIPGTNGYADVVFFDANKNYISKVQSYLWEPIAATSIPAYAVYMAFNYYRGNEAAEDGMFYVSTRPINTRLTWKLYPTINKEKGTRPKIQIYLSDSQETIFKKMVSAIYTEDCDVYFEKGVYSFDSIFYLLQSKYGWVDAFELPVGGNCHYYFNNSTLIGGYGSETPSSGLVVETNSSILGTHRLDGMTFELHDGELVADGLVYCVHDEASGGAESYVHKYENMIMRYEMGTYTQQSLSKCIGGGTGLAGEVVIDGCVLTTENSAEAASWHGHSLSTVSHFKVFVKSSYFDNGFGCHNLASNETATLLITACSLPSIPQGTRWTVIPAGNTIRS
jgi:hypothetical protein